MITDRATLTGRALEAFVVWARVLDSHRTFPFGDLHLTRTQLQALFQVAHAEAPVTPGALAGALGVTRGAVTQLVAGLVRLGLLAQARDRTDGRRRVLELTPASRARVDSFEAGLVRQLAPRFAGLSDAELATLAELLSRTT